MNGLISGKEAFDAAYNGTEAQWRWTGKEVEWRELKGETAFSINELKDGVCEFRLKPRTITLNGIEVPAPFEPNCMEDFYVIDGTRSQGWINGNHANPSLSMGNPKWRKEEEIKQVVTALRSVFNVK